MNNSNIKDMNKILLFAMAAGILLAFGSCKPKQSAYKAAYEQAKDDFSCCGRRSGRGS